MKCPECSSFAHKYGKTRHWKQRYKCTNPLCGITFTEMEVKVKKIYIINCPNCETERVGVKNGILHYVNPSRKSKQRYQCSECGLTTIKFVREE